MKTFNHRIIAHTTALLLALCLTGACGNDTMDEPEGAAGNGAMPRPGHRTGIVPRAAGLGVIDYDRCADVTSRFDNAEDDEVAACGACCLPDYHASRFVDKRCACAAEDLPPDDMVCADSVDTCSRCCGEAGYSGATLDGDAATCTCHGNPVMLPADGTVCAWVTELPSNEAAKSCDPCCLDAGYFTSGWGAAVDDEPASCICQ